MNYCKKIQEKLQAETEYQVNVVLKNNQRYTAMVKLDEYGKCTSPKSLLKKLIPNAYPVSNDVYTENGWLCFSFYLDGDLSDIRIFTKQEIQYIVSLIKKHHPEKIYANKKIEDWDFDKLSEILMEDLHSKSDELEQKKTIGIYMTSQDVKKYGDYWTALLNKD